MGLQDAEKEKKMTQSCASYRDLYEGKVLWRVDVGVAMNKLCKEHGKTVKILKKKFNHPYFDNPFTLW